MTDRSAGRVTQKVLIEKLANLTPRLIRPHEPSWAPPNEGEIIVFLCGGFAFQQTRAGTHPSPTGPDLPVELWHDERSLTAWRDVCEEGIPRPGSEMGTI